VYFLEKFKLPFRRAKVTIADLLVQLQVGAAYGEPELSLPPLSCRQLRAHARHVTQPHYFCFLIFCNSKRPRYLLPIVGTYDCTCTCLLTFVPYSLDLYPLLEFFHTFSGHWLGLQNLFINTLRCRTYTTVYLLNS